MTRVALRAPKRPVEGTKFVSRPLLPKKSEIAQQTADGDSAPREAPKRGPGDGPEGAAKKRQKQQPQAEAARAARAEQRRGERIAERERGTTCFQCRKSGHSVKNCPDGQAIVCYHCGADDHTTKGCPTPSRSFPFATCFVCGGRGHLASRCPKNEKGLYPNGGGCKYCGSTQHLMKDCRPTRNKDAEPTIGTVDARQGGDDDDVFVALRRQQDDKAPTAAPTARKPKRVIRF
ncbi:hypothetical protein H4R19_005125 [Coemansia spiralis]|nr:hypothetical protein H4R19_005125 [Coemansia spiralis]